MSESYKKYRPLAPRPELRDRRWPARSIERAPLWCSVDLRDGNQALIEPMGVDEKLRMFAELVRIGFKEIEIGFPAASDTEFEFARTLIEGGHIPEDVTIQVLVQSREHLIRRTFEAIRGAKKVIIHLYNATSEPVRRIVFDRTPDEVISLAVDGARLIRTMSDELLEEVAAQEIAAQEIAAQEIAAREIAAQETAAPDPNPQETTAPSPTAQADSPTTPREAAAEPTADGREQQAIEEEEDKEGKEEAEKEEKIQPVIDGDHVFYPIPPARPRPLSDFVTPAEPQQPAEQEDEDEGRFIPIPPATHGAAHADIPTLTLAPAHAPAAPSAHAADLTDGADGASVGDAHGGESDHAPAPHVSLFSSISHALRLFSEETERAENPSASPAPPAQGENAAATLPREENENVCIDGRNNEDVLCNSEKTEENAETGTEQGAGLSPAGVAQQDADLPTENEPEQATEFSPTDEAENEAESEKESGAENHTEERNEAEEAGEAGEERENEGTKDTEPSISIRYEYSPEFFSATEPEYIVKICTAVLDALGATAERPVIINLPSSVELSTPNVFADQVEYFCRNLPQRERAIISVHTHNDQGTGVAAAELALLAGAERVEGTLFGNGERTGNCDLITVALNLMTQGIDPGLELSDLVRIRTIYERCTRMHVYERQPYSGELVFTAFSGSHQDAISKGMSWQESGKSRCWEVPYLPVCPADIGRQYEPIIRINSQSGKGGAAYVLQRQFGYVLPKDMHPEFGMAVKHAADERGCELSADDVLELLHREYIDIHAPYALQSHTLSDASGSEGAVTSFRGELSCHGQRMPIEGRGNGPVDAFFDALGSAGISGFRFVSYHEHAIGAGSDAQAVAYIELRTPQNRTVFGVGVDRSINLASIKGVLCAVNRAFRG